jgi:hypothetical protein
VKTSFGEEIEGWISFYVEVMAAEGGGCKVSPKDYGSLGHSTPQYQQFSQKKPSHKTLTGRNISETIQRT